MSHRSTLRPMSNNAILAALRRMGFTKDEMTDHGFRAMARTILDEVLHVRVEFWSKRSERIRLSFSH